MANVNSAALLQQLLDRHVEHELGQFDEKAFLEWVRPEVAELFDWLRTIKLSTLVSAAQVKAVIHRNVVSEDIPGAIAEIAGDSATRLFTSEGHKKMPLNGVISSAQFEEFIDKFLELDEQRQQGLERIIDLPVYKDLISGVLYQAICRYIYEANVLSKHVPGVSSVLKMGRKVVNKTVPKLEGAVESNVRSYIANNLNFILAESKTFLNKELTDEQLKSSAMDFWDMFESKSLGELQSGMDSIDLSEFVVLGYEFWDDFRKTDYFQHCYEQVVDYLYETYGEESLSQLLDDLMITPEKAVQEIEWFAPSILESYRKSGQLEAFIRRRLTTFYTSTQAQACVEEGLS